MTEQEFVTRFVEHMRKCAPCAVFDDGQTVEEYAHNVAPLYWDEPYQRDDGPEACAEADISYWGEDG